MNILFCCEFYAPKGGGVQKVIQEVAERLVQRGHDVTVVTTKLAERSFKELNGVKIQEFAVAENLVFGIQGEMDNYQQFVISGEFDAIVIKAAQQWTFDALWPVLSQIKSRKIHIPCGYSGLYEPAYSKYFQQMPDILRQFDHLIFYASNYRDINFARQHGITNFSIVPNGASEIEFSAPSVPDFRKKWGIAESDFVFFTVGSPPFSKGHLEVAQAYAQLELPFSSTLILNGKYMPLENPLLQSLSAGIKLRIKHTAKRILRRPQSPVKKFTEAINSIERQSGKRLIITNLPREEIVPAFFASDLFVFASYVEYSPLVLFESAAAGLPFLSIPVGNAAEIVQWTQGGEICSANQDNKGYMRVTPLLLAKHMSQLSQDPNHLHTLGSLGRKNWEEYYSWNKIVSKYESILMGK